MTSTGKDAGTLRGSAGAGQSDHRSSALSIAIKNFSPIWFLISMDTGVLSIIMRLHPWQFRGLGFLATIMFVWNLALFCFFTFLSIVRLVQHSRHVKHETISSMEELSYLGSPAIAYLTIVSQVSLTCSTAWGYNWTILAYVLWWIGLVWTVTLCSGSVILLTRRNITEDRQISPAILLPLIGVMTQGTTGGLIVNNSVGLSATLAVPVIIVSFMLVGYALLLSFLYFAFILHKLLAVGPPEAAKLPSMVIIVGPLGQGATALQLLGTAAYSQQYFPQYNQGTFLTTTAASSVSTVCTLIALLIMGFAFMWITVAWYLIIESMVARQLPFSLTWWSLIFPMGVFTTALLNLSIALDSPGFRGLVAFFLIFLLLIYLFNWGFTLYRIWTGVAFMIPQEREQEKKEEREKRSAQNGEASGNGHNA